MTGLSQTIHYAGTGTSQSVDPLGMREMQRRVYERRDAQYLLIKSPPASGKSRALMYFALDKMHAQGVSKVIVAVPERSIGGSFASVRLTNTGFHHDWIVKSRNDLCALAGGEKSKVQAFKRFLLSSDPADRVLVCTHATLRFAYDAMGVGEDGVRLLLGAFDQASPYASGLERSLLAVDEFHHSSADEDNRLGELVRDFIRSGRPHIVAMTGSYFRGDRVPVLRPEDEERFTRVVYTYYEQLSGYRHLKTLGLDYRFYRGDWTDTIGSVLDTTRKTIVHIPSVNSTTSTGDKLREVNRVIDVMGTVVDTDAVGGLITVETPDGRTIRVADLVTEDSQSKTLATLRSAKERDAVDVVIALGMAKEGFDWIWCEHAITVGARGSLTEIVQIIGRTTRDAPGKPHAQFTNLIAEPDESQTTVRDSVNNYLKAIAASLLMEQVMAPNFTFRTRAGDDTLEGEHTVGGIDITRVQPAHAPNPIVTIHNLGRPRTDRGQQAIDNIDEIEARIIQDPRTAQIALEPEAYPEGYFPRTVLPQIVREAAPGIDDHDVGIVVDNLIARQEVRRQLTQQALDLVGGGNAPQPDGRPQNDKPDGGERQVRSILDLTRHLTVADLDINLIRDINPWRDSYAIRSRELGESALRDIHNVIRSTQADMTPEEAAQQFPRVKEFVNRHGREPDANAESPLERRLAMVLLLIRKARREREARQREREAASAATGQ